MLSSCEPGAENYLIDNGFWAIESLTYNNSDVKHLLMDNGLIFEVENCYVPFLHEGMEKEDQEGQWQFDEEKKTITISSKNRFLDGSFDICFEKDSNNEVVVLHMTSKNISVVAVTQPVMEYKFAKIPIVCKDDLGD